MIFPSVMLGQASKWLWPSAYGSLFGAVICLAVLSTGIVHAAPLTEKQVVDLFIERSPRIQALQLEVKMARERAQQARATSLPTLDFVNTVTFQKTPAAATVATLSPERTSYLTALELTQPLYQGGRIGRNQEIADLNVKRSEQALFVAQQNSISDLLQGAYALSAFQQQKQILVESQKFQEKYLQITRSRHQRGGARDFELSQAEADMSSFESRLQVADRNLKQAKDQLMTILELAETEFPIQEFEVQLKSPQIITLPPFEKSLNDALIERPEVNLAIIQKQTAHSNKWLDLASDLPSLNLVGQYGYFSPNGSNYGLPSSHMYSAALMLRIPLFSGLTALNKYKAGEMAVLSAEKSIEDQRRTVRQEMAQEYEAVRTAQSILAGSAKWAGQAEKALKQAVDSYRVGSISSTQVLQIQSSKERAALAYNQALTDYHSGLVRLRRAQGFDLRKVFDGP